MNTTSQRYKDSIYAPARSMVGKVTFDISDVTAAGDVSSITTTTEDTISNKAQLINKVRDFNYNLATMETNRFKLDGTFSFPDSTTANNGETGFCSSVLCAIDGTFSPFQILTFNFGSTHSSLGISITFDRLNNEYATDFNVSAYDASNSLITSVDVTGNTSVLSTPVGQLANYKKIVVTIKKWSKGDRRARVLEVDFGIVRVYTDSSLVSMGLVEEMDIMTATVPSAEFKFTVDNSSREFNILNPTGFYKYLQQRQQVIGEIGVEVATGQYEYVTLGNYLLWEWKSDEGSLTSTFTARTNLDLMSSFEYENLTPSTKTLYQLAVDLFSLCGVTNYSIDTALQSITTNSLVRKTNCKTILQMVAIAGRANIYVTRGNIITIKQLPSTLGSPLDTIAMDSQYQEPQIELDRVVKQVNVTYWSDLNTSTVVSVTSSATSGDTLKLDGNTLINTSTQAAAVANWILAQKEFRAIYKANWRGNPAHELADVVAFENTYDQLLGAFVTRNEINYAGYLSAKTEARGVVN
jgi:hypothetical protein